MKTKCFRVLRKCDSLSRALNMCNKKIMILLDRFFAIRLLIRSWPRDFLIENFLIIYSISSGEVILIGSDI